MPERIAATKRTYVADNDPDLIEANRVRRVLALQAAIKREADSDPPLSMEQRTQLAILLLHPSEPSGGAAA